MNKETILRAATTARLLGYTIVRYSNDRESLIHLVAPNQTKVCGWTAHELSYSKHPLRLSDTDVLGHYLVRLHMEREYGIYTPHYWEPLGQARIEYHAKWGDPMTLGLAWEEHNS